MSNSLWLHRLQHARLPCPSPRDTWSNRQIWPWSTKGSRAKANRVLTREGTGYHKYPLPTTQEMTLNMDITRWSILKSDEYILCNQRWRSSVQSAKTRPGADCGSAHELLIAKFRLKLKKVGKTTRPFSSVQFSHSVVSDSLRPHESQHTRPPSPTPTVHSDSRASS